MLIRSADYKMWKVIKSLEDRSKIQNEPDKLKCWAPEKRSEIQRRQIYSSAPLYKGKKSEIQAQNGAFDTSS